MNKRAFTLLTVFTVGFFATNLSSKLYKNIYDARRNNIETKLGYFFDKEIELGNFSGLKYLGFSVRNTKIIDKKNPESRIEANNVYLRIKPLNSIIKRKWIFEIIPNKLEINIDDNFIDREEYAPKNKVIKRRFNYEVHLNLKNKSNFVINDLGINGNMSGSLIYRSSENQLIGRIKSYLKERGNLEFKINKKFGDQFLSFHLVTNNLKLQKINYQIFNEKININKGILNSDFKFLKKSDKTSCEGNINISNIELETSNLVKNINSDLFKSQCIDGDLIVKGNNFNYGTLISNIKFNIPFQKKIKNIKFNGELGYVNSNEPEINLSGEIPYWIDKRGFNLGNLDANINLNRTQLSNLNIFRNNGIRGYIRANGKLTGELRNLNTLIDFNITYPYYKGIRIKETWDGEILNQNDGYLLKMNSRRSLIPSFLSIKIDSNLELDNLVFSRIFDASKGNLRIIRNNDDYQWEANNFPLRELELAFTDNEFEWIDGVINGSGLISKKQSLFNGSFDLSLGQYGNIKFANSFFDFSRNENDLNIKASLYPIDGGIIDITFSSESEHFIKANFNDISSRWTALTTYDLLNFKKEKIIPNGSLEDLQDFEILNNEKTLNDQLKLLNKFIDKKTISINEKRLNNFLEKFDGKYDAFFEISRQNKSDYYIKSNLSGYLNEKNNYDQDLKNYFSANLDGGLFKNNGTLEINKLPLGVLNLFFNQSKKLEGNLDLKVKYDLNKKSFESFISSNQTSINDFSVEFERGKIDLNDELFTIDLSLLLDKSVKPITLSGVIPEKNDKEVDLVLRADESFFDLIENIYGENFNFKKGDADLRMKFRGFKYKPIANGYLNIDNGEIDFFKNKLKNIDALFIFDFDELEIVKFDGSGIYKGEISINGTLPFYKSLGDKTQSIRFKSADYRLIGSNIDIDLDSNISLEGSFINPIISGNLGLKNGFINFKGNKNKKKEIYLDKISNKKDRELWPELYWLKDKDIEIISNESILNKNLFNKNLPKSLENINFDNVRLKLGPDFRLEYANILEAYLETKGDLIVNGNVKNDLKAIGWIPIKRGRANLYTTPFKLDKNNDNHILFASRNALNPYLDFSLTSKVPDAIFPISENKKDINISENAEPLENINSFGAFGIGNTRFIKIEASYKGFLDQLSFEDQNQKIKLRSTPNYNRSQIIGLIGGNSANIINRTFISQLNSSYGFSERFQLSLYPALIENNESINSIFSNDELDIDEEEESTERDGSSSQAWVAEIGLDITDSLNFAMQTAADRDDIPSLWIFTLQANEYLELLGSFDSNGDWKSQVQLFFRY